MPVSYVISCVVKTHTVISYLYVKLQDNMLTLTVANSSHQGGRASKEIVNQIKVIKKGRN